MTRITTTSTGMSTWHSGPLSSTRMSSLRHDFPRLASAVLSLARLVHSLWNSRVSQDPYNLTAMLDGTRAHFRHPIRFERRHLVLRYHSPRVGAGSCPSITGTLSYPPFSHVSDHSAFHQLYYPHVVQPLGILVPNLD